MATTIEKDDDLQPAEIEASKNALIEEVRRRRRFRRLRNFFVAVLIIAIATANFLSFVNGGSGRGTPASNHASSTLTSTQPSSTSLNRLLLAMPMMEMANFGTNGLIVSNLSGIYRTVNEGHNWLNITPKLISLQPLNLSHVSDIATFESNIWLELTGDARSGEVIYSTDGGKNWMTSQLPHGALSNGSMFFFSSSEVGFVGATLPDGQRITLATSNGGKSWSPYASQIRQPITFQSGKHIRGVPKGLYIQAVLPTKSTLLWAFAWGPKIGIDSPFYLLRSVDRGTTWQVVDK